MAAPRVPLVPPSLKVHPLSLSLPNPATIDKPPDSSIIRKLTNYDEEHKRAPHATRRICIGPMPEKVVAHFEAEVKKQDTGGGMITLNQLESEAPEESEDVSRVVKGHAKRFVEYYKTEAREKRKAEKVERKASRKETEDIERVETGASNESGQKRLKGGKRLLTKLTSPVIPPMNRTRTSEDGGELSRHTTTDTTASSEDWGEEYDEQNIVDDLTQRWKESEWGKAWRHRRGKKKPSEMFQTTGHWLGGSFEVGTLLGVNLLNPPTQPHRPGSVKHPSPSVLSWEANSAALNPHPQTPSGSGSGSGSMERTGPEDVNSQTGLLAVPGVPMVQSDKSKGKQRVKYASPPPELEANSLEPPAPAPPEDVLARSESEVDPHSSSAAMFSPAMPSPGLQWEEVLMRDRMLVRVVYSRLENISPKFDDSIHRTTRDLQFEDCAEFMVVWRKDLIELYEDHTVPGKEMVTGHKHLAYVIPLRSDRTNLSLYSFVDLTFCITCQPTSTRLAPGGARRIFSRSREGTNIFLFQHKNRSRAWDWTWQLWRYLGGTLPPSIEVHNPRLNSTVTIDIPYRLQVDTDELYAMFTRDNIIQLCVQSLSTVPDWFALVEQEITQHGKRLDLCWRRDAHLDWLWLDEDVYGNERPWATLAGLAVQKSSRPASLEIRITSHAPSYYHLKHDQSTKIHEPPSIEGYVYRIRPNSQKKQSLYLSTHNGLLFMNLAHEAYPPLPPGLALTMQDLDSWIKGLHTAEVIRGANQVMHASGVCDLRSVVLVRRACSPVPAAMHQEDLGLSAAGQERRWYEHWNTEEVSTLDDDEDEGGETVLARRSDRGLVRMRRCFELLLNTGHVVRFECHSRKFAVEWVNRLRALILFWQTKKRTTAKEEIELAQARRPRLTPQIRVCQKDEVPPEPPADMSAPYAAMDNLYHWCIIDGCNPITKVSKLHMRKGLRGQYKPVYLALVQGHLVRFRIKPKSAFHIGGAKKINLLDAYVFSGYFAAMNLPSGQFRANAPTVPRRYLDGLETDDREEDMLFMVWYHSHPWASDAANAPTFAPAPTKTKSLPNLSRKASMLVFRTRSRIERDAWCWALGTEIEKIARVQRDREEKMRDMGSLIEVK